MASWNTTHPIIAQPPSAPPPTPVRSAALTTDQAVRVWLDLLDTCDEFLRAGLQARLGPDADIRAAYRQWYAEYLREHDEMIFRMAARFAERIGHGR